MPIDAETLKMFTTLQENIADLREDMHEQFKHITKTITDGLHAFDTRIQNLENDKNNLRKELDEIIKPKLKTISDIEADKNNLKREWEEFKAGFQLKKNRNWDAKKTFVIGLILAIVGTSITFGLNYMSSSRNAENKEKELKMEKEKLELEIKLQELKNQKK